MFRTYIFYNNLLTRQNFLSIQSEYSNKSNNFNLQNVHFIDNHQLLPQGTDFTLIYDTDNFTFDNTGKKIYVSRISDAGKIFSINRGITCQNVQLENFVHNINFFDLNIEKLNSDIFCQKYITW